MQEVLLLLIVVVVSLGSVKRGFIGLFSAFINLRIALDQSEQHRLLPCPYKPI